MDANALLLEWPSLVKANAETILSSPAWRMPVSFAGGEFVLTKSNAALNDTIDIRVTFDDEEHILGIGDSPAFADLHLLWAKRAELPPEILLALVEKECGPLFQMLEDSVRKQFSVKGFSDAKPVNPVVFELANVAVFSLDLSPAVAMAFGKLECLDPSHAAIRSLERDAAAEYAVLMLTAEEISSMKAGDFVMLPEHMPDPSWRLSPPEDDAVHVLGASRVSITFAQLADDALPPVPPLSEVDLSIGTRVIAKGELSSVGLARAVKLSSV